MLPYIALFFKILSTFEVSNCQKKKTHQLLLFLSRGGLIKFEVNGHQRYSSDLPQGGLEPPSLIPFIKSPPQIESTVTFVSDNSKQLAELPPMEKPK